MPMVTAIREVLTDVNMKGCWFNYIKILGRKWKNFNLPDVSHEILRYCFAIPTLPASEFKNAIDQINQIINDNRENYSDFMERLRNFIESLRLGWQPYAESISFYKNKNDSINISEYFDRHLGSEMGSLSPNIFQFSERLKRICNESLDMYSKLEKGFKFEFYEKNSLIKINSKISKRLELLADGKISLIDYLESAIDEDMFNNIMYMLEAPQFNGDDGK
ncbi:uncharacterized protein LOC130678094 [Microplitis mediator]|uniref:uncharacterized protein LOC130678090 n=1 Tax=Microplitis mediator TaxID=375433 RepID=UPI002554FDBB|nr:uncharacterized protein LOC130678090 [Microplitis mediator]XP_057341066.1 uncharacterized protein LOC130678094 [Microplitis mediator]